MLHHLKYPIIQAPMAGGYTTVDLITAVSNAGAMGSLGAEYLSREILRKTIREIKAKTSAPFNVNLFTIKAPKQSFDIEPFCNLLKKYQQEFAFEIGPLEEAPSYIKHVEVLLEEKVPIFSFTLGMPEKEIIREMHKQKTYVIGTATHLEEVHALDDLGVDAIVCQGKEAGGHRGTFIGDAKDALVPTCELVRTAKLATKLPLIASGGLMVKKDVQKALKEGAAAVQLGTVFLTCHESGTSLAHRKALLQWHDRKTVLTMAFSGKWARGIENRFMREMASFEKDIPPFPYPVFLLAPMRKAAKEYNNGEFLPLWAGEHFSLCKEIPVKELILSLI